MTEYKPKTKTLYEDYHIRVEVDDPGSWTNEKDPEKLHERWQSSLASVARDIKRHVDDVINIQPYWNVRKVCVYCESTWELDDDGHPVCCNEAVEDFEKATYGKCGSCGLVAVNPDNERCTECDTDHSEKQEVGHE